MVSFLNAKISLSNKVHHITTNYVWYTRELLMANYLQTNNINEVQIKVQESIIDLADVLGYYYGKDAGNESSYLLTNFLFSAIATIEVLNDPNNYNNALSTWQASGTSIGQLLKKTTNHDIEPLIQQHINTTLEEAQSLSQSDWSTAVIDFYNVEIVTQNMSNAIVDAISNNQGLLMRCI
jgi:hypothetical protein